MAKPALDDLLSKARDNLHDENIVTLLGEPDAGKTVASALLKHALFAKFIPFHGGRFEAMVVKGAETADRVLREMKAECAFPSATPSVDAPQVELEIHKMNGEVASKIKLVLQDSSGEACMDLLHEEFDDPEERLEAILEKNRNGDVGPLAPYVFSKVYLLVIGCPDGNSDWDLNRSPSAVHALRQVHRAAKLTHNDKVRTHIAILFTKSDKLNDSDRIKPASALLESISQLKSALNIVHGGKLECFKLSVDVELESPEDRDRRVSRLRQRANDALALALGEYEEKMAKFADEAAARERKKRSGYSGVEEYVEEARSKAEQKFRSLNAEPTLKFAESKESGIKHKVKQGFNYSQDEYVRLIEWIVARLCD